MKIATNAETLKVIMIVTNYSLEKKLQTFEISQESFLLLWNKCFPLLSATFQSAPHLKASKLSSKKLWKSVGL